MSNREYAEEKKMENITKLLNEAADECGWERPDLQDALLDLARNLPKPVAEIVSGYSGDPDTRGSLSLKKLDLTGCTVGDKLYRLVQREPHWTDPHIEKVSDKTYLAYDEAGLEFGTYATHDAARDALVVYSAVTLA